MTTTKYLAVCLLATLHAICPLGLGLLVKHESRVVIGLIVALYWTWPVWVWPVWRGKWVSAAAAMVCALVSLGALLWVTPAALILTLSLLPVHFHI